jgi:hypothetical protein
MCMFCRSLFLLCTFSFVHCVICSSSISDSDYPFDYLQTLLHTRFLVESVLLIYLTNQQPGNLTNQKSTFRPIIQSEARKKDQSESRIQKETINRLHRNKFLINILSLICSAHDGVLILLINILSLICSAHDGVLILFSLSGSCKGR